MTQLFLPEGRLRFTEENQTLCASLDGLRKAMEERKILEGITLLCDTKHDLVVRVGPFTGLIPRNEVAIGIAEGTTREVAILSRVGKSICFTIDGIEGNSLLLSRRKAQQAALNHILSHWAPGDVISTAVTRLEAFGLFVDIGCGLPSLITLEQLSVSRIPHPRFRFDMGDELLAVVTGIDPLLGRVNLSHKALLGTWMENAALFFPGTTVPGIVRSIKSYGIFIELTPNLAGLAEPHPGLVEGDHVSVFLKAIQPERHKIKLIIIDKLFPESEKTAPHYFFEGAHLDSWHYLPNDTDLW